MKTKKKVSREKRISALSPEQAAIKQLQDIGRAFRIKADDLNMTILEVAEGSQVSRVTISKIFKGQLMNCGIDTLSKIAAVLKLSLSISVS